MLPTFETCPDVPAAERKAHAFAAERFGKLPLEMSVSRAREYLAKGWGVVVSAERAEIAIGAGSWVFASARSFDVAYQMDAGRSAGGFDRGSRPVRYSTYTTTSIDAWARQYLAFST